VFHNERRRFNYVTTRDLNLSTDSKPAFEETFDFGPLDRYEIECVNICSCCISSYCRALLNRLCVMQVRD